MANENQIQIEIVLDDGSIQKGFAKISEAGKKSASDTTKEFKTLGDVINNDIAGSIKNAILDIPIKFAGIATAGVVAGIAIKKAFDFTIEGEKLKAIEAQFDSLASGAGISGELLKSGLEKASDGLVSTNDLFEKANSAIINLGSSAAKLPDILELSRKATLALGGSIEDKFNALVSGIESGNARALKQAGIILDVDKAYKEYAKTLGLTAGDLNKSQQQQALLNAVLTEGNKKFKDVDSSVQPLSDNIKRISVAVKDASEAFSQFINSKFGESFANISDQIVSSLGTGSSKSSAQIRVLENDLKNLQQTLKIQQDSFLSQPILDDTVNRINKVSKELQNLKDIQSAALDDARKASRFDSSPVASASEKARGITKEQITLISERQAQVLQQTIAGDQALLQAKEQAVNNILNVEERQSAQEELYVNQRLLLEQQVGNEIALLQLQLANDSAKTEEQKQSLILSTAEKGQAQLIALDAKRVAIERSQQQQRLQTYSSIAGQIATLQQDSSSELQSIGKAAAITQATIDGYLAVQNALANVPYPFNFAAAALVGAAAAANVARIASTGPGGGGASSNFSQPSGGGIASQPGEVTNITEPSNIRSPQGTVVVNIDNVLGDEGSGKKIVDLINSAFDSSGVNLRTGVV